MANVHLSGALVSLLLVVGSVYVHSATDCTATSVNPCRCEAANGVVLDISDYFTYPKADIQDSENPGDYTYKFSPCETFKCDSGDTDPDAKVCQLTSSGAALSALGRKVVTTWTINNVDPLNFVVTIDGGDPVVGSSQIRRATFTFSYSEQSSIAMTSEDKSSNEHLTYQFDVKGKQVVPAGGGGGGGGGGGKRGGGGGDNGAGVIGWVLISLGIVGLITYFVVGGLVNYYHRGARGLEVIPNYTFWKDLPFLIKDGFVFTFSPCYSAIRNKISYRSL